MRDLLLGLFVVFSLITLFLFLHIVTPSYLEYIVEFPIEFIHSGIQYVWNETLYTIEKYTKLSILWLGLALFFSAWFFNL